MHYGCIGEQLTHSFSREIHNLLADNLYELKEIPAGQLDGFMKSRSFKAINVTIPYKQAVIPYLEGIDDQAAMIGAVNTIVNRNGLLYGYNTDFGGLDRLIRRTGIDLQGKKVLILGTGGTSNTAMAVANSMGAAAIYKVSRSPGPDVLTYEDVKQNHLDAQVLINTTPRGMYTRESGMAIDPTLFPNLCGAVDAVYNPLRTTFIQKAQSMGVSAASGLYMLVHQAVLASEIFLDTKYPEGTTEKIYHQILSGKENIVLIGMPTSGKSTVGKYLADKLGRQYLDIDILIREKHGLTPAEIIRNRGEEAFRDIESQMVQQLAPVNGAVISTGGGVILRQENVDALKQNGRLFFLDRPVDALVPDASRPLASTREAVMQLYNHRYPIYLSTADVHIPCAETVEQTAHLVERSFFHEDLGDQWT